MRSSRSSCAARPRDALLTSNSSAIPISRIAEGLATRERMFGLHYFMPAHSVPLVEVVYSDASDAARGEELCAFMRATGKVPVKVRKDVPGFLANRLQHALCREAFALIESGVASPEDVDLAVRFSFGFRFLAVGPMLQRDHAGLDVHCAASATIYPDLADNKVPAKVLRDHVAAGHHGIKSGRGFYEWTPESIARERERYNRLLDAALKAHRRRNQGTNRIDCRGQSPLEEPCVTTTIPKACGCRSSSTRRPTASSRPSRWRPCTTRRATSALEAAGANAKRLGLDRRSFLVSACGAATTLLGMNAAYARSRHARAASSSLPDEAALDQQLARSAVDGSEFIFDVQGHFVNPTGAWLKRLPAGAKPLGFATSRAELQGAPGPRRFRLPAVHRPRPVREGRLHGLGHRPHGAVVRAVHARGRAAHDRGGRGDGAHRREAATAPTASTSTAA